MRAGITESGMLLPRVPMLPLLAQAEKDARPCEGLALEWGACQGRCRKSCAILVDLRC